MHSILIVKNISVDLFSSSDVAQQMRAFFDVKSSKKFFGVLLVWNLVGVVFVDQFEIFSCRRFFTCRFVGFRMVSLKRSKKLGRFMLTTNFAMLERVSLIQWEYPAVVAWR